MRFDILFFEYFGFGHLIYIKIFTKINYIIYHFFEKVIVIYLVKYSF